MKKPMYVETLWSRPLNRISKKTASSSDSIRELYDIYKALKNSEDYHDREIAEEIRVPLQMLSHNNIEQMYGLLSLEDILANNYETKIILN
jgi:hypothetical protein